MTMAACYGGAPVDYAEEDPSATSGEESEETSEPEGESEPEAAPEPE